MNVVFEKSGMMKKSDIPIPCFKTTLEYNPKEYILIFSNSLGNMKETSIWYPTFGTKLMAINATLMPKVVHVRHVLWRTPKHKHIQILDQIQLKFIQEYLLIIFFLLLKEEEPLGHHHHTENKLNKNP